MQLYLIDENQMKSKSECHKKDQQYDRKPGRSVENVIEHENVNSKEGN